MLTVYDSNKNICFFEDAKLHRVCRVVEGWKTVTYYFDDQNNEYTRTTYNETFFEEKHIMY